MTKRAGMSKTIRLQEDWKMSDTTCNLHWKMQLTLEDVTYIVRYNLHCKMLVTRLLVVTYKILDITQHRIGMKNNF